jgi:trk system potassium uptake protein
LHLRIVASAVGVVVAAAGVLMLLPLAYSLVTDGGTTLAFAVPAGISLVLGTAVFLLARVQEAYVSARDVFLIVVLGWISVATVGAVPFVISDLMNPVDAYFEAMSGFTTTGATTLARPEDAADPLLLWRSLCQWTGGIGIVVLFVAVGPLVGFGAVQLYSAEVANPVPERLTPRIRDTAKILALVYFSLTAGGIISLSLAGVGLFDAVNHSLTTVSTGGFSTHSDSIAYFDSWAAELAITAGMFLSGVNFALYFQAARGRTSLVFQNPELRAYVAILGVGTAVMTTALYVFGYKESLLLALREASFQSVSLLTGTAFNAADWNAWDPLSQSLLVLFMLVGACAGSTAGGLKVIRSILLLQHARQQIFRMVHPQAVTILRIHQRPVPERLRVAVLGFFFVYVATLAAGTLLMTLHQVPLADAFGSVFACVSITGTFLGPVGTAEFYAELPPSAKLILTLFMLLGRLELFTVLIVLTPAFWQR